jgi:hypothetical protein
MTQRAPGLDAPAILDGMLRRCRRRQRLIMLASNGLVAALGVSAIAVPLFVLLPASTAIRFSILAACVGSLAAITVALVRTSPVRRIAAIADARLGLDDCLVAAFQFIDDHDVVSRLVVRNAAIRAEDVSPADVFPFRWPARIAWVGMAAVAAAAMLTVATLRPSAIERAAADPAGPRMQDGGVSVKAPGGMSSQSANAVGVPSAASRGAKESAPERSHDRVGVTGSDPSNRVDASREMAPARPADATAVGQADRSLDAAPRQIPRPPAEGSALRGRTSMASRGVGGAGGMGSRGSSSSDVAGGVSAGAGRAQSVAGGMPGARGDVRQHAVALPDRDAGYRESAGRAEAALANERMPPGLRAYLKAYFVAISPR